jgi:hypothetical protein
MLAFAAAVLLQSQADIQSLIEALEKKMLLLAEKIASTEPENAERLKRGAKMLRERWASGRAAEALEEWKRGNAENALRHGESVTESLRRLLDILEGREKPKPDKHRTPEEILVELEEEIQRLIAKQEELNPEVKQEGKKALTREQQVKLRGLAARQEGLARTVEEIRRRLEGDNLPVFAFALERVESDMEDARARLHRYDAAAETQSIQEGIVRQLKDVLEAVREKRDALSRRGRDGDPGQPPEGPGAKPRLPDTAELGLIRKMQMDVYERTRRVDQAMEGRELGEAQAAQLRRLSDEQGKLASLMKQVIERLQ